MVERHSSPDGVLHLVVQNKGNDLVVGFEGLPWHTHGDILGELLGCSPHDAINAYVYSIINDEALICTLYINKKLVDAWITEDPDKERVIEGESLFIRQWTGQVIAKR